MLHPRTNIVYKGTMYANALDLVQALFFMEGFLDDVRLLGVFFEDQYFCTIDS